MAYAMHIACPPEGEDAAYEAASKVFDASVSARDALELPPEHQEHEAARARVSDAYDAMLAAHASHFHLTTWAMSECRAIMDHFRMLSLEQPPDPAGSKASAEQTTQEQGRSGQPEPALRDHPCASPAPAPLPPSGIALYKLSGSHGWLVTPGEIRAALAAYEASRTADPALLSEIAAEADWWPEWIDYLRRAADQGGFRVHGPSAT
ncbi:hypothetical protein [Streptomyces sp. NPDC005784]|uniref:hypothetical protein n=1 Tax=Streptomyces sp. NPDC005784 TaxID=3364731 RepID=UPI0036BC4220